MERQESRFKCIPGLAACGTLREEGRCLHEYIPGISAATTGALSGGSVPVLSGVCCVLSDVPTRAAQAHLQVLRDGIMRVGRTVAQKLTEELVTESGSASRGAARRVTIIPDSNFM